MVETQARGGEPRADDPARALGDDRHQRLHRRRPMNRERRLREPVELRRTPAQRVRLPAHLGGGAIELDEHGDLRAQHVGNDGRGDVVDRAQRVAARLVDLVAVRGDENDGRMLRAWPLTDEPRRLEAVHDRHVDVEENGSEVAGQQTAQRIAAGADADDVRPELGEHRLQRRELVRVVVDDEDVDARGNVRHSALSATPSTHAATSGASKSTRPTRPVSRCNRRRPRRDTSRDRLSPLSR